MEAYPDEWRKVQRDVGDLTARNDVEELKAYVWRVANPVAPPPGRARARRERLSAEIRRQMTIQLLKQVLLSAAAGKTSGRLRFNLFNGYIAQSCCSDAVRSASPCRCGGSGWCGRCWASGAC